MKRERNILVAFILNLAFSVFGLLGGLFCGSVAILSDALHDVGDAASIGISYFLERKSRNKADKTYTYGYARYSVLGGVVTTLVLTLGSVAVIINSVKRIISPVEINYDGMLVFAIVGVFVNFLAAFFTREKGSVNQRAINLHMLEDVLGWLVVLIGTLVMKLTDVSIIDPLMSIGVSLFILINAAKNLKEAVALFLEKAPLGIDVREVEERVLSTEGVEDAYHIHVWSLDESRVCATLHVVVSSEEESVKARIRSKLADMGIAHITIEVDSESKRGEGCDGFEAVSCGHCRHHH